MTAGDAGTEQRNHDQPSGDAGSPNVVHTLPARLRAIIFGPIELTALTRTSADHLGAAARVSTWLKRLDPAPNPAPALPLPFLVCFTAAVAGTIWLLATNRYLPGQDISYHAHCARAWLEAGRAGSAYAGYEPANPLEANTLMYSAAALLSRFSDAFAAYRFVQAYYFIGLPCACLYALRALGRSPWGSLLAFPLCYTEIFAAGYANMAFAAPTFILALVAYWRYAQQPTARRGIPVAVLFALVFLSHAHVYLWLGALLIAYSLAVLVKGAYEVVSVGGRSSASRLGRFAGGAALAAAPSLLLFARWYARGYGQGHSVGSEGNGVSFATAMEWFPLSQMFTNGALQAFDATTSAHELHHVIALVILAAFALAIGRAGRDRSPPLPELTVIVTITSFYFLPAAIAGQGIAVRQWYFVFWLTPLIVTPIPLRFGAVRSIAVVGGILMWTAARMALVTDHLRRFTSEEMAGFDQIVASAPRTPGLLVAYAAVNARSKYWLTSPMYHSYGFLSAQRSYDGPLEYSDAHSIAAVRYTSGPPRPIKHLYGNPNWPLDPVIWQYDLVLVYRWTPTPAQERVARERGTRLASAGEWQLWRSNKP